MRDEERVEMVQIKPWVITGDDDDSIWSQAIVLQKTDADTPKWFICVSLENGPDAGEDGQEWLHHLGQLYEQDQAKAAVTLLQLIKTWTVDHPEVNVFGGHLIDRQLTCFTYGFVEVQLIRSGHTGTILGSAEHVWKQSSGQLEIEDTVSITTNIIDAETLRLDSDVELSVEHFQATVATGVAAIIFTLKPVESNQIETTPIMDEPKKTWWQKILERPKQADTPEILIKRRRALFAGWIVLGLLVLSVLFGAQARERRRLEAQLQAISQRVSDDINVAQAMQSVDQVKARQILRDTQEYVGQKKPGFAKNEAWQQKLAGIEMKLTAAYEKIAAEAALSEMPVWFSLSVVKSGMKGSYLTAAKDCVLVYDQVTNTLVKIDTASKRAEILSGGDTTQGTVDIAATDRHVSLLKPTGIESIAMGNKTSTALTGSDSDWREPRLIESFNANLYLVDQGAGEIWRYAGSGTATSGKQRWLGPGISLPAGEQQAMAIDGDVWLLQKSGRIIRYRRGAPVSFSLNGLDEPLSGDSRDIVVSHDQDRLLVLDAGKERIIQFNKQGNYVKQVKWSGLAQASGIALDDGAGTLYVLRDGALHTISL